MDENGIFYRVYFCLNPLFKGKEIYGFTAEGIIIKEESAAVKSDTLSGEQLKIIGKEALALAHEIGTPLGISVTIATDLADKNRKVFKKFIDGELKKSELEKFLENAEHSSYILISHLNSASMLIRGFQTTGVDQMSGRKRSFNLAEYFNTIKINMNSIIKKGRHHINVTCSSDIILCSYPGALYQIFSNLIINSVKHGFKERTEGIIAIHAEQAGNFVEIIYRDNGIGLSDEGRKKIYDPYYTTASDSGGSGLGMSIVYSLITDVLSGDIECDGKNGFRASIKIPLQRDDEAVCHGW